MGGKSYTSITAQALDYDASRNMKGGHLENIWTRIVQDEIIKHG